jgi:hypothetical protein
MAYFYLRHFAPGRPVAHRRIRLPRPRPYTVVKAVDQYEQLVVGPRASAGAKTRRWEVSRLAVASLAVFFVLVLGFLGLTLLLCKVPLTK